MSCVVSAPNKSSWLSLALLASVGAGAAMPATASAGEPSRVFADNISSESVVRHSVDVTPNSTWAFSLNSDAGAARLFVSTHRVFQPLDAACAGESTCMLNVGNTDQIYVFVFAASDDRYAVTAAPAAGSRQAGVVLP